MLTNFGIGPLATEGPRMKKLLLVLVAAGALFSPALRADNYPSKPITLVNVFGPGSTSDAICRVIAQPLGIALKETVIVEDRPGASGALAALYVAHAAPDGHTLMLATNSPLSAVPFMMKTVSYDPVKDFTAVTRVGSFTLMLVVNSSLPRPIPASCRSPAPTPPALSPARRSPIGPSSTWCTCLTRPRRRPCKTSSPAAC